MLDRLLASIIPFDHLLTSVLQVVIVLDVLGLVAYFLLGGLKSRRQRKALQLAPVPVDAPASARSLFHGLSWRRAPSAAAVPAAVSLEVAYADLRRVLDGYHEGLA
jgi:hypothetical protein